MNEANKVSHDKKKLCEKLRPLLGKWKLKAAEAEQVRAHLEECEACQEELPEQIAAAFARGEIRMPEQLDKLRPPREALIGFVAAHQRRIGIRATALGSSARQGDPWARDDYMEAKSYLWSARPLWKLHQPVQTGEIGMGEMGPQMGGQVPTRVTLLDEFWQPVGESDAFTIKQQPTLTKEGKFVLTVRTHDGQYEGWKLLCTVQAIEGRRITFEDIVAKAQTWPDDAPAVEPLTAVLRDTEGEVRRRVNEVLRAVEEALERIGDAQALETLVTALLKDKDSTVRRMAAQALGQISNPQAVPPLITALRDIDEEVRESAARALGEIGDSSAVPTLLEALQKDEDLTVRQMAVRALGEIGDPSAIPALLEALRDRNEDMRRIAQQSIDCINCELCRQGQIWEVHIEEPILDPSEEDVVIPQDVVQLYLAPPPAKADVPGTETSS